MKNGEAKLRFLGVGNFFTTKDFHTNIMIERNEKKLLIDAGSKIDMALEAAKLSYLDLDAIYISHLHGDHAGGMEYLGFGRYFDPRSKQKPVLFCQTHLMKDLWMKTLSGGMRSVQGKQVGLEDYFDCYPIPGNGGFIWEDMKFNIVQVVHIMDGYSIIPSFGLIIAGPRLKVFITTDTQFNPHQIKTFYDQADLIIHDCERTDFMSGVHAHYNELKTLPDETKKKMVLAHYQDKAGTSIPQDCTKDGFLGWASRKETFGI